MGIAGFQKWLLLRFGRCAKAVRSVETDKFDHVCFDLNHQIHATVRRARDQPRLIKMLFGEVDRRLKCCIPLKSVFLAMDGPGPLGKLVTQRARRTKPQKIRKKQRKGLGLVDPMGLTPGCELLYKINQGLEYFAVSRLQEDRKYSNVDIRLSGPDVPGEGELKIFDWLNSTLGSAAIKAGQQQKDSILVFGGDADIVLQGLCCRTFPNIFIYVDITRTDGFVISIPELVSYFEEKYPGQADHVRLDFVMMCMFRGNDYLPKIRGSSFDRLWIRYQFLKSPKGGFVDQSLVDTQNRTFNWPFLAKLLSVCHWRSGNSQGTPHPDGETGDHHQGTIEEETEIIVWEGEMVRASEQNDSETDASPTGDEADEDENGYDSEVLSDEGDSDSDDNAEYCGHPRALEPLDSRDIEHYMRGLLWNLQMYIDGYCPDYKYVCHQARAPTAQEIISWIADHDGDPLTVTGPLSTQPPFEPLQAAIAMLPSKAYGLLPSPVQAVAKSFGHERIDRAMKKSTGISELYSLFKLVEDLPLSMYSEDELARLHFGSDWLFRRNKTLRHHKNLPVAPFDQKRPLRAQSHVHWRKVISSTAPPCLPWAERMKSDEESTPETIVIKKAFSRYVSKPVSRLHRPGQATKQKTAPNPAP